MAACSICGGVALYYSMGKRFFCKAHRSDAVKVTAAETRTLRNADVVDRYREEPRGKVNRGGRRRDGFTPHFHK